MKAAIYSPYLDTFGGGEKYMMTIAEVLSKLKFDVDVVLDEHLINFGSQLKTKLSERFNLNLSRVNFIKAPIGKGSYFLSRLAFFKKYDLLFYLTDGSIFFPTAKKNVLHIQSPLVGQPAKSFWGKLKLKSWNLIIYNSKFTKKNSEKNWPLACQVIYPPIDTDKIKPLKKKKYILSVGRFFGYLRDKKHELLIRVFSELYKLNNLEGWSLHLAGAAQEGDRPYLEQLRKLAVQLPVNFYPNIEYDDLVKLYGESCIYWHAAGYGEDDPTKMEHFGISTVEAMAAGCVPIVIGKGGQVEIVEQGKSGFLWDTTAELIDYTKMIIKDEKLFNDLSVNAILRSQKFSKDKFQENIKKIVL